MKQKLYFLLLVILYQFNTFGQTGTHLNFVNRTTTTTQGPDLIEIPYFARPGAFTIEAWVRTTGTDNIPKTIFSWSDNLNGGARYSSFTINDQYIQFTASNDNTYEGATSSGLTNTSFNVNNGQWHHIAVVKTNATSANIKFYIDGLLIPTFVGSGFTDYISINSNANTTMIGAVEFGTNNGANTDIQQGFTGDMDELRIWNIARTDEEIARTKNCELQGNESGLVSYYKFNQGTAAGNNTSITSATATTGSNGTIYNFIATGATSNFVSGSPVVSGVIMPSPLTGVATTQAYCANSTVANLLPASSSTTKWFTSMSGGSALATTATLSNGTYYVANVNANGCESARVAVVVTIDPIPTAPSAATQILCGSATIASLIPAASSAIKWYDAASGGSALATTTTITSGTYYVSETNANGCESLRTAVTVTINTIPTAPTAPAQTFCSGKTVADLVTTSGTNIKWYSAATGGTALANTTTLTAGNYFASQTVNSCESTTRTSVAVTINPSPAAPSANAQIFLTLATVADLVTTSGTNIKWYSAATGGTPLANSTSLITGNYFASQTVGTCESARTQVAVTANVSIAVDAGPATATFCANAISAITAVASTTTTNNFQGNFAPSNWTFSNNNNNGNVNTTSAPGSITLSCIKNNSGNTGNSNYSITKAVPLTVSFNWSCAGFPSSEYPRIIIGNAGGFLQGFSTVGGFNQSGTMTVNVPAGQSLAFDMYSRANYGDGSVTISNLVVTSGATYSWVATNGGSITGASNTASVTPATSGTYTVTATNINGVTATDNVVVTINPVPTAPTASAQTLCGSATIANLIPAASSAIKWYATSSGGSALATTTAITTGTYYVSETINGCESLRTAVTVTINTIPTAPTASAQTFCNAATVANLVATGSGLQWYAASTGGTALASTTALATGTYYVSQTLNSCESATRTSVSVTLNVTPAPTASAQTFCNFGTVADLVATGSGLKWYAASTGGTALVSTTNLATGTYYVSQTLNSCESATRTSVSVILNVTPAPTASAQTFCNVGTVADLVATGTGTKNWYVASTGGTALVSTTNLATGTYYVSQTLNSCESATRTSVSVILNV
ncbi:LamG-like jellyroll fold domain-containing protein, partial [Flavobacterium jumunjinense]